MSEARRGCGFRKIGGLYMVAEGLARACGRFPIPLEVCPCCGQGIKQTRGWTWVEPHQLLAKAPLCKNTFSCVTCPLANPAEAFGDRAGLLWIGTAFYPTPEAFSIEAAKMGVCRRIMAVPTGFELGKHWVLLAHPKAILGPIETDHPGGEPKQTYTKGIVFAFKPSRIEKMITEEESNNPDITEPLVKRGITPVVLPDIPIHRGTVYDADRSQQDIEEAAGA